MSANAPGQLLGYTIQFPRALYHLLSIRQDESVSIEFIGDLALLKSDGTIQTEEDKSSIVGNPLTDRSTDLWKTFSNWVNAVKAKELDINKSNFLLFTNQKGRSAIVNTFHDALNDETAKKAVEAAKKELSDITEVHEIWQYYNNVCNQNENLLIEIIKRFELEIENDFSYDSIKKRIREKLIAESQVEFILQNLSGWLQKIVIEKIAAKSNAIITWEEFHKQFLVLFERSRRLELIDFALQNLPGDSDIDSHRKEQPLYLKQLSEIEITDEDEIIEAVSDYIRARVNRDKWIENDIIDETVALDFETRLTDYWKNIKRKLEITNKNISESDLGKLLYTECKMRNEKIRDMEPPAKTISGTYHALANEPLIGWHPTWEKSFKK